MKNFKHLNFNTHGNIPFANHARAWFDNGYGISVVATIYDDYEIAVIDTDGALVYDTPITDDVIRCFTSYDVSDIMAQIQNL